MGNESSSGDRIHNLSNLQTHACTATPRPASSNRKLNSLNDLTITSPVKTITIRSFSKPNWSALREATVFCLQPAQYAVHILFARHYVRFPIHLASSGPVTRRRTCTRSECILAF